MSAASRWPRARRASSRVARCCGPSAPTGVSLAPGGPYAGTVVDVADEGLRTTVTVRLAGTAAELTAPVAGPAPGVGTAVRLDVAPEETAARPAHGASLAHLSGDRPDAGRAPAARFGRRAPGPRHPGNPNQLPATPDPRGPAAASVSPARAAAVPDPHPALPRREAARARASRAEEMSERLDADPDAVSWLDLHDPSADDLSIVTHEFGLHPLAVEDAVHDHQRPKLDRYRSHLFGNMYAVSLRRRHRGAGHRRDQRLHHPAGADHGAEGTTSTSTR